MAADSLEDFLANVSEDGTHECIVDSVSLNPSNKDGRVWLVFRYEVDDENSPINGEELTEMVQDFSHLKMEDLRELTPADRSQARKAVRRKRDRLIDLGVPEEKLDGFSDWDSIAGARVSVTVETSTSSKKDENGNTVKTKYVNVKNVYLI